MLLKKLDLKESIVTGRCSNRPAFDHSNRFLSTCSFNYCVIYDSNSGEKLLDLKHESRVVFSFFVSSTEIKCLCEDGKLWIWNISEMPEASVSSITDERIVNCLESEGTVYLVVETNATRRLCSLTSDNALESVCNITTKCSSTILAVSEDLVVLCKEKTLSIIPRNSSIKPAVKEFHLLLIAKHYGPNVHGLSFTKLFLASNKLYAALSNGMIIVWDGVKTRGMGEFSRLNWHGSGAVLQVTLTGTLLSAGAERVLCKWLPSSNAPSTLARLPSFVTEMKLSPDSTLLSLVCADNSIVVIDTAAMEIRSNLKTPISPARAHLREVIKCDDTNDRWIVKSGGEGRLEWFDAFSPTTSFTMDVSLDGGVDKNRSYDRQTMAFHHVNHVAMSGSFVVTVEKVEGGVVGDMRMRVWRRKMDTNTFELLLSQSVGDIRSVTGSGSIPSPFFILSYSDGRHSILCETTNGWIIESSKNWEWKDGELRCVSNVSSEGLWAVVYEASGKMDAVVITRVSQTGIIEKEVVVVEGIVKSVYASNSLVVVSTKTALICVDETGKLKWKTNEGGWVFNGHRLSIATKEKQLVVLDVWSGRVEKTFTLSSSIKSVFPSIHSGHLSILVLHTDKSLSVLSSSSSPSHILKISKKLEESDDMEVRVGVTKTVEPFIPRTLQLSAPAHMLPPVSIVSPSFLSSCLQPLPV